MSSSVGERIARSASAFRAHVWPIVSPLFGPGELVPVEMTGGALGGMLDRHAGIDYFFRPRDGLPLGLASRVSDTPSGRPAQRRFTMGDVEHRRLTAALSRPVGRIIPAVRIHASVTRLGDQVVAVDLIGLVLVAELIRLGVTARSHNDGPTGSYWSWDFDALTRCGVTVTEVPHPRLHDPFIAA